MCLNIWMFAKKLQTTQNKPLQACHYWPNVQLHSAFKNITKNNLLTYSSTVFLIYFLRADSFSNNSWMLSAISSYQTRQSWSPEPCLIMARLDFWGFHCSEMRCCVSALGLFSLVFFLPQLKGVKVLRFLFLLPLLCGLAQVDVWVVYASQRC